MLLVGSLSDQSLGEHALVQTECSGHICIGWRSAITSIRVQAKERTQKPLSDHVVGVRPSMLDRKSVV